MWIGDAGPMRKEVKASSLQHAQDLLLMKVPENVRKEVRFDKLWNEMEIEREKVKNTWWSRNKQRVWDWVYLVLKLANAGVCLWTFNRIAPLELANIKFNEIFCTCTQAYNLHLSKNSFNLFTTKKNYRL